MSLAESKGLSYDGEYAEEVIYEGRSAEQISLEHKVRVGPHDLIRLPMPDLTGFNEIFGRGAYIQARPNTPPNLSGEFVTEEPKKMTAAQMARWEKEQERLQLIADENERLRLEEEKREFDAPLIPRLQFSDQTRVKIPSISPRDKLSYTTDKKYHKEIERFHEKNPSLHKLLVMLHQQIVSAKPENILDYLAEDYLSEENAEVLRREILQQETSLRELANPNRMSL